jgi:hypothetical protein
MSWQTGSSAVIREKLLGDLQAAERTAREDALQALAAFRGLLLSLAQQVDGSGVQEVRRVSPDALQAYTPEQWQQFLEPRLKRIAARLQWADSLAAAGGGVDLQPVMEERDRLRAAHERLQRQAQEAQLTLQETQRKCTALEERLRQAEAAYARRVRGAGPTPPAGSAGPSAPAGQALLPLASGLYTDLFTILRAWQPPDCPAQYRSFVSEDILRWRRQSMALYLLAAHGLNARFELDHLIGRAEGLKSRPGSLRNTLDQLSESGLTTSRSLLLKQDSFQTSLALVRLSQQGKELCQSLGWPAGESDWERLIARHEGERFEQHTLGVLAFGVHARARGWQVQVMPEVGGPAVPDVCITKGEQRHYVEVELGDREKENKWRNLAGLQGHVALCAGTVRQRAQLVSDCRVMKMSGLAADLETLVPQRFPVVNPDSLWSESW